MGCCWSCSVPVLLGAQGCAAPRGSRCCDQQSCSRQGCPYRWRQRQLGVSSVASLNVTGLAKVFDLEGPPLLGLPELLGSSAGWALLSFLLPSLVPMFVRLGAKQCLAWPLTELRMTEQHVAS